jgi:hypothetical protein
VALTCSKTAAFTAGALVGTLGGFSDWAAWSSACRC